MAGLITIDEDILVNICPDNSSGKNVVIAELDIQLPKQPPKNKIFHGRVDDYARIIS